jgi:amino acid adenylation domain-containing protein
MLHSFKTENSRPLQLTVAGQMHSATLTQAQAEAVATLASTLQVSQYTLLLSAFSLFVLLRCSERDVLIGSPVSTRHHPAAQQLIGYFVNVVPLRFRLTAGQTFASWVASSQQLVADAVSHADLPLTSIINELKLVRAADHAPLLQLMFSYLDEDFRLPELAGLQFEMLPARLQTTDMEFALNVVRSGRQLHCHFEFNSQLFSPNWVADLMLQWQQFLAHCLQSPQLPLAQLPLQPTRPLKITAWPAKRPLPATQSFMDFLPELIAVYGENHAVISPEGRLSYRQLYQQALDLAGQLQVLGVSSGSLIGLHFRRDPALIPAIWAVWLCGAAIVPFDLRTPLSYKNLQTEQINLKLMLGDVEPEAGFNRPYYALSQLAALPAQAFAAVAVEPQSVAAVYFTSGSTGLPKAVQCHHAGYWQAMFDVSDALDISASDRIMQFSSLSFDVFLEEMYLCWLNGAASVWILGDNPVGINEICRLIDEYQVTTVEIPTAYWHQWAEAVIAQQVVLPATLRQLLVGGEKVDALLCQQWPHQRCRIINVYGSTETSITNIICDLSRQSIAGVAPIGKPLRSSQLYVLDDAMLPVGPGQKGELYIAGPAVGDGYLNSAEQQQLRFLPRIDGDGVELMFRTGDTVIYDEQGILYCFGRKAFQIKYNGFSIELSQIEQALRSIAGVTNAAVSLLENEQHNRQLVGFVETTQQDRDGLRTALAGILPHYMLPDRLLLYPLLPMNSNGKIDRKLLEQDWRQQPAADEAGEPLPDDEITAKLIDAWRSCLASGDTLSRESNFFVLGGSSVALIRLSMRLQQAFAREVPVAVLMEHQTLFGQYQWLQQEATVQSNIPRADIGSLVPLSSQQMALWTAQRLAQDDALYRIKAMFVVRGELDEHALRQAYQQLMQEEPIYRIRIVELAGQLYQQVQNEIPVLNWVAVANAQQAREWFDRQYPATGMFQLTVVTVGPKQSFLLFDLHHLVTDEWSVNLLNERLLTLYRQFRQQHIHMPVSAAYNYLDYVLWQHNQQQDRQTTAERFNYLRNELSGIVQLTRLPADQLPDPASSHIGHNVVRTLPLDQLTQVREFAAARQMTTATVLQAVFSCVLRLYWNEPQINFACSVSQRQHQAWQQVHGYFVQSWPLQHQILFEDTFEQICSQVNQRAQRLAGCFDLSMPVVLNSLADGHLLKEIQQPPIVFNYVQQQVNPSLLKDIGFEVSYERSTQHKAKFDLTLNLLEYDDRLECHLDFRAGLYSEYLISHFADTLLLLAMRFTTHPQLPFSAIDVLGEADVQQLVHDDNQTSAWQPVADNLSRLFELKAAAYPDMPAVLGITPASLQNVALASTCSYARLNMTANQTANWLLQQRLSVGSILALVLPAGVELISAMLGAHKIGATVVMFDPQTPLERLQQMVDDSAAELLVVDQAMTLQHERQFDVAMIAAQRVSMSPENLLLEHAADQRAFLVYTSGSTGKPKAIANHHRGLINVIDYQCDMFDIQPGDKVLQYASVAFEGAIADIYMPLLRGACCCVLLQGDRTDLHYVNQLIQLHQVNIVTMTPSAIPLLLPATLKHVKSLLAAGEMLPVSTANYAMAHTKLFNLYGPSECSLCTTIDLCDPQATEILLGRRVRQMYFYLLNEAMMPVPPGAIGEICIGGIGVTAGYYRNPELTRRQFVADPLFADRGLIYRSGDLARYKGQGKIQFVGRNDQQIKLRGQRIELREIEQQLCRISAVQTAQVLLTEASQTERQIVAFVTAQAGELLSSESLLVALRQCLPGYMVPARLWLLDEIPCTPNGKADKHQLLAHDVRARQLSSQSTLTASQSQIWQIWSAVVQPSTMVTPYPQLDFFAAGGNSLHLTKTVTLLQEKLGLSLSLSEFLLNLTLEKQAAQLDNLAVITQQEEVEW